MAYRRTSWTTGRDACDFCGEELTGEQARFCAPRCRTAFRRHGGPMPATRECEVCGAKFTLRDLRQKRCKLNADDGDAGPGDRCWELQEAEAKVKQDAEDARDYPKCLRCGEETEYLGGYGKGGRHRKFCSDKCRVYYHREQKGRKRANTPAASER